MPNESNLFMGIGITMPQLLDTTHKWCGQLLIKWGAASPNVPADIVLVANHFSTMFATIVLRESLIYAFYLFRKSV